MARNRGRGRSRDREMEDDSPSKESMGSTRYEFSPNPGFWDLTDLIADPSWIRNWVSGSTSTKPAGITVPAARFSNPNLFVGSVYGPNTFTVLSGGNLHTELTSWLTSPILNNAADALLAGAIFSTLREGIVQYRTYELEDVLFYMRVMFHLLLLENAAKAALFLSTMKFPNLADLGTPLRGVLQTAAGSDSGWDDTSRIESQFDLTNIAFANWFLPAPIQELAFWIMQPRYLYPDPKSPIGVFGHLGSIEVQDLVTDKYSTSLAGRFLQAVAEGDVTTTGVWPDITGITFALNRQLSADIFRVFGPMSRVQVRPWRDFTPVFDPEWLATWVNQPLVDNNMNISISDAEGTFPALAGSSPVSPAGSPEATAFLREQGVYPWYSIGEVSARNVSLLSSAYAGNVPGGSSGRTAVGTNFLCVSMMSATLSDTDPVYPSDLHYLGFDFGDDTWVSSDLGFHEYKRVLTSNNSSSSGTYTLTVQTMSRLEMSALSRQMYQSGWKVNGGLNGVDNGRVGFHPYRIPFEGVHPRFTSEAIMRNIQLAWSRSLIGL